jgi:hypothetical protein
VTATTGTVVHKFSVDKNSDVQVYSKLITQALCEDLSTCDDSRWLPLESFHGSLDSSLPYDPTYQQLSPSEAGQLTDGAAICEDVAPDGSMYGCRYLITPDTCARNKVTVVLVDAFNVPQNAEFSCLEYLLLFLSAILLGDPVSECACLGRKCCCMCRWMLPTVGMYAITACLSKPVTAQPACSVLYVGLTEQEWEQRPFSGVLAARWSFELPEGAKGFAVNDTAKLVIDSPVDNASAMLVCSEGLVSFHVVLVPMHVSVLQLSIVTASQGQHMHCTPSAGHQYSRVDASLPSTPL